MGLTKKVFFESLLIPNYYSEDEINVFNEDLWELNKGWIIHRLKTLTEDSQEMTVEDFYKKAKNKKLEYVAELLELELNKLINIINTPAKTEITKKTKFNDSLWGKNQKWITQRLARLSKDKLRKNKSVRFKKSNQIKSIDSNGTYDKLTKVKSIKPFIYTKM